MSTRYIVSDSNRRVRYASPGYEEARTFFNRLVETGQDCFLNDTVHGLIAEQTNGELYDGEEHFLDQITASNYHSAGV